MATATPGPAALLVSVNSLSVGVKKSLVTVLGNVSGLFIMSGCSILGLSAVVLSSSVAFTIIKVLGAVYLIYMGLKLWNNGIGKLEACSSQGKESHSFRLYMQGVLVALTNPKAIVFTTALFPQFISVTEPLLPQFALLVSTFMALSFICLSFYAVLAQRAKSNTRQLVSGKILGRIFGSTFIGAGCILAGASK
nr:LysE family translocator [Endozoicomonas sp. OPT23]